jgi:hypothetical protein
MGSEHKRPSRIGLGHPPCAESKPLRLRISFIGVALRRHAIFLRELATRELSMPDSAGFFPLDHLPEPKHGIDRKSIALAREFHFDGRVEPYFDPL